MICCKLNDFPERWTWRFRCGVGSRLRSWSECCRFCPFLTCADFARCARGGLPHLLAIIRPKCAAVMHHQGQPISQSRRRQGEIGYRRRFSLRACRRPLIKSRDNRLRPLVFNHQGRS